MSWRDLLANNDDKIVAPWIGTRHIWTADRAYAITGPLPQEHGWYEFQRAGGRGAKFIGPTTPGQLTGIEYGYLVGNRFASERATRIWPTAKDIANGLPTVHLIEPGVDRFTRVAVGRTDRASELYYRGVEFPAGVETEVSEAYLNRANSLDHIKGVPPALVTAFLLETAERAAAEERRAELERQRLADEARLREEARVREIREKLGDGAKRRELAATDFGEAAKAALAIGGAELLDWRALNRERTEFEVKYRYDGRRLACICDGRLQIITAGICLTDHRGVSGDKRFSLESLPSVIREAIDDDKLVILMRV